jgi:hypothetical protein
MEELTNFRNCSHFELLGWFLTKHWAPPFKATTIEAEYGWFVCDSYDRVAIGGCDDEDEARDIAEMLNSIVR